jgi:hypothetical protein
VNYVRIDVLDRFVDLGVLDHVIAQYFPEDRDQGITDLYAATAGIDMMVSLLADQPSREVADLIRSLHKHMLDLMVGNVQETNII